MALQVATDHDETAAVHTAGCPIDEKGGGNNRGGGTWIVRSFDRRNEGKQRYADTSWIGGIA